jgi:hypothetical protein
MNKHISSICIIVILLLSGCVNTSEKMKITKSKLKLNIKSTSKITTQSCDTSSVTGINGSCSIFDLANVKKNIPSDFSTLWNSMEQVISSAITGGNNICFGDFTADSDFASNTALDDTNCNTIPLSSTGKIGITGFSLNNIPCPKPTEINFCVAYDKCGTFAISLNAGLPVCASYYLGSTTGIIAAIAAVASSVEDAIDHLTIGISIFRRFENTLTLTYPNGDSVVSKDITTKGHVVFNFELNLPGKYIKINGKDLSDILTLSASITFLIDFGDVASVAQSAISTLQKMNTSSALATLDTILASGPELSLSIDGKLTFEFEKLTGGFLPDFSFVLADLDVLLTAGSGTSGLKAGFYMHFNTDIARDLVNVVKSVIELMASPFSNFGISSSIVPSYDIEFGLFANTDALGFKFAFFSASVSCMYKFSAQKFSCSVNAGFITAIIEAGKWVFKKASKLFDTTGDTIVSFTTDSWKATVATASKSIRATQGFVKNISGKLVDVTSDAYDATKNEFINQAKTLENTYNNTVDSINKAAAAAQKAIEDAAKKAAEEAEAAAAAAKKAAEDAANAAAAVAKKALCKTKCLKNPFTASKCMKKC